MSAWPTTNIVITHMDASTDDPSQARPDIKQIADNINAMIAAFGTALGVATLDATGKIVVTQLPTIPADKGGTGQTAYSIGDLLYATSSSALGKLAAGANNYVLTSNGPGSLPSWKASSLVGAITASGLTQSTARLLGRTTASTGAVEEIQVGSGLSFTGGLLDSSAKYSQRLITESSDIALAAATASTQSSIGSTFTADIPANGRIRMTSFSGRILNNGVSGLHETCFGIRIGTTNYWFGQHSNNGSYEVLSQFGGGNTANLYREFNGVTHFTANNNGNDGAAPVIDVAALSVPTGSQTVQLIAGYKTNQTTLKGTNKQTRVSLEFIG